MEAKKYNTTVKDKLFSIQKGKKESDLFPTLKQLFIKKDYACVEITHGNNEFGKDLVFKEYDQKLKKERWYSLVVKNKDSGQENFEESGEITRQVKLSFQYPYIDSNGNENYINSVIIVVNGKVSRQAKDILNTILKPYERSNVEIWNYQRLEEEISNEIKDIFLDGETSSPDEITISKYKFEQIKLLSNLGNAKDFFIGLDINEINDIFVNIRTTQTKYEEEKNKYKDKNSKNRIIEEADDSISIINSGKSTLIQGIATSGKSLLLKRIGINALQKCQKIGVFLFKFRELSIDSFDIDSLIKNQFKNLTNCSEIKSTYFDKYIILFDGLDEIILESDRIKYIEDINTYIANNKTHQIIISGRNIDIFDTELFNCYEKITLLPFDIGQAFKLVKKIIPNNNSKAEKFIQAIKNGQLSNNLARTPMALTLMAILYKDDAIDLTELPANITELYNKFCDYYLNRWDSSKGLSSQYKFEETKHILGIIAQHIHSKGMQEINIIDLKKFLTEFKSNHSYEELNNIEKFIDKLKDRTGIIVFDNSKKVFSFNNLSFQEYFSSIYYDDSNEDELIDNIYNIWWENIIIFYNGKNPKRDIFINKVSQKCIPGDIQSRFLHVQILSKCLQASHLISNESERNAIKNIIYTFDQLYKSILEQDLNNEEKYGMTYSLTTLDVILQFRQLFNQLFQTKHIDFNILSNLSLDILTEQYNEYSDLTLYCLSYYLANKFSDATYFEHFISIVGLNTRWDRIVFRDVEFMRLKKLMPEKTYNRIRRKQEHNKQYISQQFKEAGIKHLIDGINIGNTID